MIWIILNSLMVWKKQNIAVDRKILAELAVNQPLTPSRQLSNKLKGD